MLFGPMAVLVCGLLALQNRPEHGWVGGADVAFWIAAALLIAARVGEFRSGASLNSDGSPAAVADMRRYVVIVGLATPIVWLLVRLASFAM